jgi:hypothetical protein
VIIDYLLSKQGLRFEQVDVSLVGIRLARGKKGLVPQSASRITGTMRLTLADLSAAIARPEVVDTMLAGLPGIARPDIKFANGDNGGIKIIGSVEAMGRRIPLTASTKVTVQGNRLVLSATRIEGLPILNALPLQLLDLELPLNLPLGLTFTSVTTEPGCLLLGFEGTDVDFDPSAERRPSPGPKPPEPGPEPAAEDEP